MIVIDQRIFFAALGFTAVAMQGEKNNKKDNARRALALAQLIEEFCRTNIPEAFENNPSNPSSALNRMVDTIVCIYKETGGCQPEQLEPKFTENEIVRYWPRAMALACVQLDITFKDN
ncbi:MAG: hypothetical protein WAO98_07995 [Alphaproteobacteria bacterium]